MIETFLGSKGKCRKVEMHSSKKLGNNYGGNVILNKDISSKKVQCLKTDKINNFILDIVTFFLMKIIDDALS